MSEFGFSAGGDTRAGHGLPLQPGLLGKVLRARRRRGERRRSQDPGRSQALLVVPAHVGPHATALDLTKEQTSGTDGTEQEICCGKYGIQCNLVLKGKSSPELP